MQDLLMNLRQSLRALWRAPSFTLPILVVLGLGLGANLALHSILETVLFRPLPVAKRDSLILVKVQPKGERGTWLASHPAFEDLKAFPGPFAGMVEAVTASSTVLHLGERRLTVALPMVGDGWFRLLGLRPSMGRTFSAEEEAMGAPVVVLSHHLWRTAFQGDPAILGRAVPVGAAKMPMTVVGVGPAGFEGLELGQREDLWMPLKAVANLGKSLPPAFFNARGMPAFAITARLKDGATRAEAQAALNAASAAMAKAYPDTDSGQSFVLETLEASEQVLLDRVLPQRTLLLLAAGFALLLVVVGTSGLFAARAARREKELATRCALGADGSALIRPLLLEAVLLALMVVPVALGSGLFLARCLMQDPSQAVAKATLLPALNGRILALGLGLSFGALLLAALVPMLRLRRLNPARALAAQGSSKVSDGGGGPFVAAQVALSLALLCASSVALRAFKSAARMGYPTAHRAFMVLDASNDPGLTNRVLARLRAMPEVAKAARSAFAPLGGGRVMFGLQGGDRTQMEHFPAAMVGAQWFSTLGAPLVAGRDFTARDGQDKIILNESLAQRFFPGASAVGRTIQMGSEQSLEVVGVVKDHRMRSDPEFHLPMIWLTHHWLTMDQVCVLAEGRGSAKALLGRMKEALALEKPGAEPSKLITMEDHVAATLHQEHQNLRLLSSLGLSSMLLACFGLWAALNLQVAMRGRELGIRAALGATARQLAALIFGLGTRLVVAGLGVGLLLVLVLGRLSVLRWPGFPAMASLDLILAAGALTASALLACLIPALRAARINPAVALRNE